MLYYVYVFLCLYIPIIIQALIQDYRRRGGGGGGGRGGGG